MDNGSSPGMTADLPPRPPPPTRNCFQGLPAKNGLWHEMWRSLGIETQPLGVGGFRGSALMSLRKEVAVAAGDKLSCFYASGQNCENLRIISH